MTAGWEPTSTRSPRHSHLMQTNNCYNPIVLADSRDDQSVIDVTKVDPNANQQTGATLPDPPQVVIEGVQSDDYDASKFSKQFATGPAISDELIEVTSMPSSGDHGSTTLWQKPSEISKEEVVSPRRLKVLEKARAALASTKVDEIKQQNEERVAAAQAREEADTCERDEPNYLSKESSKDEEIAPEKKFYKELSERLMESDNSETEKKAPDSPKVFNFAELEPSSDESCTAKKETKANSSESHPDTEKSAETEGKYAEQEKVGKKDGKDTEKRIKFKEGKSQTNDTTSRVDAVLGLSNAEDSNAKAIDEGKNASSKEEKDKSSAFARLRETLKQLDVTGVNGPKRRKEKRHRKMKRKQDLPTKPILSDYSQEAALATSEVAPSSEKETHTDNKETIVGDANNEVPNGPQRGILKNGKEESRVRFGFFQSGETKIDSGKSSSEITTIDQATPKHSNANFVESSEKSVHSQTGARSIDNRSNYESDAQTFGDDTESKVSLVSYLGSVDSDLETNFESSTVPMLVKMLDRGCAWLEGNNCGMETPSLLKESNNKSQFGFHGKANPLPQSNNAPMNSLLQKSQLFAPGTAENLTTKEKKTTPKAENQKSADPKGHSDTDGENSFSAPKQSEELVSQGDHEESRTRVDNDTFDVRSKGNQHKSMANILHETSRIERMRAAANSDIWRRPATGPNVGSHLKPPTPLHYEHSVTEIQSSEGYEIQPETPMPVFESQYHAPRSNNAAYILDPVGQNIGDSQRFDLEANHSTPSQTPQNNSDPPDVVQEKLPDPDSDHEGFTGSMHRLSQDYGVRMCMEPQEIISEQNENEVHNLAHEPMEGSHQNEVEGQNNEESEQPNDENESPPVRLSVDPDQEQTEQVSEVVQDLSPTAVPSTTFDSKVLPEKELSRSRSASRAGRSKSVPRAGGPEGMSSRCEMKEVPLHFDNEVFMGLTDDERLAALKLAEKLRGRAEKLKRRKKREKKLKRIRSG